MKGGEEKKVIGGEKRRESERREKKGTRVGEERGGEAKGGERTVEGNGEPMAGYLHQTAAWTATLYLLTNNYM